MKRLLVPSLVLAFSLAALASSASAQSTFKVPFNFQSGGKHLAAGSYTVTKTGEGQLTFRQVLTGKETVLPFTQPLKAHDTGGAVPAPNAPSTGAPPAGPPAAGGSTAAVLGARLVFDEVGDFQPSYTEYITVYVLAEAWLAADEGYLVHVTKGAHKTRVVPAEK